MSIDCPLGCRWLGGFPAHKHVLLSGKTNCSKTKWQTHLTILILARALANVIFISSPPLMTLEKAKKIVALLCLIKILSYQVGKDSTDRRSSSHALWDSSHTSIPCSALFSGTEGHLKVLLQDGVHRLSLWLIFWALSWFWHVCANCIPSKTALSKQNHCAMDVLSWFWLVLEVHAWAGFTFPLFYRACFQAVYVCVFPKLAYIVGRSTVLSH